MKNFKRTLQSYKWFVIAALWVLSLALGYIGFAVYYTARGESQSVFDLFYLSLQLVVLQSGALPGHIPWQLEIARLLAPAMGVYTALTALAAAYYEQWQLSKLRFYKNHVVICGLGRKGMLLAREFCARSERVVVIELNENNNRLEPCKDHGAIVLVGSATDRNLLKKARVIKAKHLISICGDDGVNAEIAVHARTLAKKRHKNPLTCIVHIVDLELCNLLRQQEIRVDDTDMLRIEFFNVFESGARALLSQFSPFDTSKKIKTARPHLLVVGLGQFGESLVKQAALNWREIFNRTKEQLEITVIDRDAISKTQSLTIKNPHLEKVLQLNALEIDIDSPHFLNGTFLRKSSNHSEITRIYVCLDNDSRGLSAGLALHHQVKRKSIPIVIRMTRDSGLATLLRDEEKHGKGFSGIHAFGVLEHTCKPELLLGGTHEVIARAIHEEYVRGRVKAGDTTETNPALVSWEELPEHIRESNRRQADHIGAKLRDISCGIELLTNWEAESFEFAPDELEWLSQVEHERWMEERLVDGWKYREGPKNLDKKTSPWLIPYEELPEEQKENDRTAIRGMPAFLARAGLQIFRLNKAD